MKKYIFLIPQIGGIGGGQLYLKNKIQYLRCKGWIVDYVYSYDANVIVPELRCGGIKNTFLSYSSYLFSSDKMMRIVDDISSKIQQPDVDTYYIESTCMQQSLWGEMIAKKIGGKHFVYLLQESNILSDDQWFNFYDFKHKRKELAGIQRKSLSKMFAQRKQITETDSYFLPAYCTNVVDNYKHDLVDVIKNKSFDYVIGCISRLDKPFMLFAIKDVAEYCNLNPDKKFILLLIGGAPNESKVLSKIRNIFTKASNVELIFSGYMFPISKPLVEVCDVCFSSAGSAEISKEIGIPTVAYDANDYRPIGVFGFTTNSTLYRTNEPLTTLTELFDKILIQKLYPKSLGVSKEENIDFSSHLEFIQNSSKNYDYFDVSFFKPLTNKDKKLSFLINLVGVRTYNFFGKIKNKLVKS